MRKQSEFMKKVLPLLREMSGDKKVRLGMELSELARRIRKEGELQTQVHDRNRTNKTPQGNCRD